MSFVDDTLKNRPWLTGDNPTIADIGCWGRMVFMHEGGFEIANWPRLQAWSERLKAMPGFALPYDLIPSKDREYDPVCHQTEEPGAPWPGLARPPTTRLRKAANASHKRPCRGANEKLTEP